MFDGFANVWSPVLVAKTLKRKPLAVTLAGEKLVLFRSNGKVSALLDQCPHRGAQLSLGTVTAEGCLKCPFHEWQFGADGGVKHVPLNPDAKRDRLFASRFEARELGGLIWIYTAPGAAPSEPVAPDGLTRPDLQKVYLQLEWNCHWTRAMENMLDAPHVPYVHRTTIGRPSQKRIKAASRMVVVWEPTAHGGHSTMDIDESNTSASLDFYMPNMMSLNVPIPNQTFRIQAICVPVGPKQTRMIIVGARSFAKAAVLNPLFNYANRYIAEQDRAIVEGSFPVQVPPAGEELSVATDRVTLQFRKYFYEQLASGSAQRSKRLADTSPPPAAQ